MEYLEYMKVYDLVVNKKECRGVYLGFKYPSRKYASLRKKKKDIQNMILLDKPSTKPFEDFSLKKFEKYSFENGKLKMSNNYPVRIPRHQEWFYRELWEEKLGPNKD